MWVKPAWVVVGVPVPGAENPFLAAPAGFEVSVGVDLSERPECSVVVRGLPGELGGLVERFASKLIEGLGGGFCIDVSVEGGREGGPVAGFYAAVTAAIVYSVGAWHGESMDVDEVLETARLVDPFEAPVEWATVIDALRYASLEGGVVVYRSEEERAVLPGEALPASFRGVARAGRPLARDDVGPEVYNGLVHTAGAAALAAAVMVRDGEPLASVASRLSRLLWGLAYALWGVAPVEGCLPSPGLPGSFEVACPEGAG